MLKDLTSGSRSHFLLQRYIVNRIALFHPEHTLIFAECSYFAFQLIDQKVALKVGTKGYSVLLFGVMIEHYLSGSLDGGHIHSCLYHCKHEI